jgi:hypothetical protein
VAKYASPSVVIEIDDSGGTPVDISQHVLEMNGIEIETLLEEGQTFGDSWFESFAVGIRKLADITLSGFYDDTALTGPDVLLNAVFTAPTTTTRTLKVTYGGGKSTAVEVIIYKYKRLPVRNGMTKYEVMLRPTGAVTEA